MIIKYEFIDGKKVEIAVSTELGQVILQFDKEAKNNDRRETRRLKHRLSTCCITNLKSAVFAH